MDLINSQWIASSFFLFPLIYSFTIENMLDPPRLMAKCDIWAQNDPYLSPIFFIFKFILSHIHTHEELEPYMNGKNLPSN